MATNGEVPKPSATSAAGAGLRLITRDPGLVREMAR